MIDWYVMIHIETGGVGVGCILGDRCRLLTLLFSSSPYLVVFEFECVS